ncbi:MAG: hypothetical protein HYU67_13800, partial [Flavobacteriia bacterium]|nr:hypothetical protein [Flavobacteriia bacterium]
MKKIIFSFSNHHKDYIVEEKFRTKIYQLSSCKKVLQVVDAWHIDIKNIGSLDELTYEGIECEYMSKLEQVWIWCAFFIKEQEYKKFQRIQESIAYDDQYEEYYDKRWEEAPKVKIFIDDWQNLQQQWKQIKKELPQYVIFTLDDSGPIDKIE